MILMVEKIIMVNRYWIGRVGDADQSVKVPEKEGRKGWDPDHWRSPASEWGLTADATK